MDENDTPTGGEAMSVDDAAKAYAATLVKEPQGQPEPEEADQEANADDIPDEEVEGESDTDGQAEEETGAEPGSDQGRFVASNGKVKLPDDTVLTVADLIQGNLRDKDYRQKTMEASEVRKTYLAQSEALKASEQQLAQQRDYVASLVKSVVGEPPDPSMADPNSPNFDPIKYQADRARFEQWGQHLSYLDQMAAQSNKQRQAETVQQQNERLQRELATAVEKMPELKDAKRAEAFARDIQKFGSQYGYSQQELAAVPYDHRSLLVLKKAIAWDKLQASKANVAKQVEGKPAISRGGKSLSQGQQRARVASDAMNRAKQTGRVDDAAAAYLASRKTG
jgi:hypothetical protein